MSPPSSSATSRHSSAAPSGRLTEDDVGQTQTDQSGTGSAEADQKKGGAGVQLPEQDSLGRSGSVDSSPSLQETDVSQKLESLHLNPPSEHDWDRVQSERDMSESEAGQHVKDAAGDNVSPGSDSTKEAESRQGKGTDDEAYSLAGMSWDSHEISDQELERRGKAAASLVDHFTQVSVVAAVQGPQAAMNLIINEVGGYLSRLDELSNAWERWERLKALPRALMEEDLKEARTEAVRASDIKDVFERAESAKIRLSDMISDESLGGLDKLLAGKFGL